MGLSLRKHLGDFVIHVTTSDAPGAGSDADIFIILKDKDGRQSKIIELDRIFHDDFERGKTDSFVITDKGDLGDDIVAIELWRDEKGLLDDWHVDMIVVEKVRPAHGQKVFSLFPVNRWIPGNKRLYFMEYDASLPQSDPNQEQRKEELENRRQIYEYEFLENLPPRIKELPKDEEFDEQRKWDSKMKKNKLKFQLAIAKVTTGCWNSLDDFDDVFKMSFGRPDCVDYWMTEEHFGAMRLVGVAPTLITLCQKIPENFGVTSDMVEPSLEGSTLEEAMEQKRIFLVDLSVMEGLEEGEKVCAPLALFYQRKDYELIAIAIQLMPAKAADNPVFLPSDPKYTWLMAKTWFNCSEANYHQSIVHLAATHLVVEGILIATYRTLSTSHPVFRLLAPHFRHLLNINVSARSRLINRNGWFDKVMRIKRDGAFELARKVWPNWRMDLHGMIPKELEQRGVLEPGVLPNYYYRDDCLLLWEAIKNYATTLLSFYYDEPSKIIEDYELQSWTKEMSAESTTEGGGCGIKGIPGNGSFDNIDDVISTVTSVIFISSVGHAAVNFGQYENYAFHPNYPGKLIGDWPTDKNEKTEADLLKCLANKEVCMNMMFVTKMLSERDKINPLGKFETQYLYDPRCLRALNDFQKELESIEEKLRARNKDAKHPFIYTYPSEVPNSISL